MALMNYMGDAPGFMSYERARRTDSLAPPERAKPAQEAPPVKNFDLDFEGNPGDKQWLYDRNNAFNSGLQSLYKEYGGEMDWVRADNRYKQLVAEDAMFVKNQQAAIQNRENTKARLTDLKSMSSGQANSDYELEFNDGIYVAKKFNNDGTVVTKGNYAQEVISDPQVTQHEDGSIGLQHTQFDYGTGDENDMTSLLNQVFSGLGANEWGNDNTTGGNMSETDVNGITYKVGSLVQNAHKHKDNYQQVNDATNYLIDYGFDENHKYYISQKMMHDYEANKSFTSPKIKEDGTLETDKNGNPVLEEKYLTKEDVINPARMKMLMSYYVQDYVSQYAKKYLDESDVSQSKDVQDFANVDPNTGQKIVPQPELERWEAVTANAGPKDKEHVRTNTTFIEGPDGKVTQFDDGGLLVYNEGNFGAKGMDQAKEALFASPLSKLTKKDGKVMVGGLWQDLPSTMADAQVSDVIDVRQVRSADGKSSEWVATVAVVMDEDAYGLDDLNVWDPDSKSKQPIYGDSGWWNSMDGITGPGYQNKVIGEISRADIESKKYIINQDSDTWYDDDTDKPVVYIQVPVGNQMDTWDQFGGVGTSAETNARRRVEVNPRANETMKREAQEGAKQSQAKSVTEY